MHCPSLPAIAHERQVPVHAVAQQTPVTQKPGRAVGRGGAGCARRFGPAAAVHARGAARRSRRRWRSRRGTRRRRRCTCTGRTNRCWWRHTRPRRRSAPRGSPSIRRTIARGRSRPSGTARTCRCRRRRRYARSWRCRRRGQSPRGSAPTGTPGAGADAALDRCTTDTAPRSPSGSRRPSKQKPLLQSAARRRCRPASTSAASSPLDGPRRRHRRPAVRRPPVLTAGATRRRRRSRQQANATAKPASRDARRKDPRHCAHPFWRSDLLGGRAPRLKRGRRTREGPYRLRTPTAASRS
jgi:hypothetical protein